MNEVPESEQVPDGSEERFSHVRVSFRLPVAAAYLLRSLQSNEPDRLRSLGVLSVEVDSGNDTRGNPSCSPAASANEGRSEDVLANARSLPQPLDYNGGGNTFSPSADIREPVSNCLRQSAADMVPSTAYPSNALIGTDDRRRTSVDYQVLSPIEYQQMVARETVDAPLGQYPRCRLRSFPLEATTSPWQCQQATMLSPQPLRAIPKRVGRPPTPATVSANSPLLVGLLLQSSGSVTGRTNPLALDGLDQTALHTANSPAVGEAEQGAAKSMASLQKPKRSRASGTRKGSEKRMRSKRDGGLASALRANVDAVPLAKLANMNQRQPKAETEADVSSQYGDISSCVSENTSSFSFATKLHRETTINEVIQSVVLNAPGQDGFVDLLNPDNSDGQHYPLRVPDGGRTSKRLPSNPEDLNDCNLNPSSALSDGQSPQPVASTDILGSTDLKRDCLTPHMVPYSSAVGVSNSVSYPDLRGGGSALVDVEPAKRETENAHLSPSGDLVTLSAQVQEASFCNLRRSLSSKSVSPVAQSLANGTDRRTELPESDRQDDWDSHCVANDLQEDAANASKSSAESNKWARSNQTSEAAFLASDYLVRTDHDYAPLFDDSLNHASPQERAEDPGGTLSDGREEDCLVGKAALNSFEEPYDQDGQTLDVSVALLPQQVSSSQRQNHQWAMPTEMPFEQNVGSQ